MENDEMPAEGWYYVILRNDDAHGFDEVTRAMIRFAGKCPSDALMTAITAHVMGFAPAYCGDRHEARLIAGGLIDDGYLAEVVTGARYEELYYGAIERLERVGAPPAVPADGESVLTLKRLNALLVRYRKYSYALTFNIKINNRESMDNLIRRIRAIDRQLEKLDKLLPNPYG